MIYVVMAIGVITVILLAKGVRIVPQAENWIVERFGKYVLTLQPGLNLINPIFSRISKKVDIRERVLDLPSQRIITSDNATVDVNGVLFFKIMDPYKSYYGVSDMQFAISALAKTSLRAIMGKMTLDESLSKRDSINKDLMNILDDATDAWGTKLTRVEIQDIEPPDDIKESMAKQMKAERNKRAQILDAEGNRQAAIENAEGDKRAAILKAEGAKEAAGLQAQGRERLAQAEAEALRMVAESLKSTSGDPTLYLLGREYIQKLSDLSESQNSKFIVFPADIIKTISGIIGK